MFCQFVGLFHVHLFRIADFDIRIYALTTLIPFFVSSFANF